MFIHSAVWNVFQIKEKIKKLWQDFFFIENSSAKHIGHIVNFFRSFIKKSQIKVQHNISTNIIDYFY